MEYKVFESVLDGSRIYMPRGSRARFDTAIKKMVNWGRVYCGKRYYCAMVTLTTRDIIEGQDDKNLMNRVLSFIRRRLSLNGAEGRYVWVREFQERGAVHYHCLWLYNKPYVFPSADDIAQSWRLGFVKVSAPKLRLRVAKMVNYMAKYLGKDIEGLKVQRRFGASQMRSFLRLSWGRLEQALRVIPLSILESCRCTYRRIYLDVVPEGYNYTQRLCLMVFPSVWRFVGVVSEPF